MKKLICIVLVTLVALIGPKSSEASMHLMLTSGATSVTIDDGGAGDLNAVAGAITFVGAVGSWTINVSTGIGFPVLGSLTLPHMDLNSVNTSVSAGVPDPLTVKFTQTDNTGDVPFLALIGGTTSGTVTYNVYADSSNAAFGMADLVTTFTTAAA